MKPDWTREMMPDYFQLKSGSFFEIGSLFILASGSVHHVTDLQGGTGLIDRRRFRPNLYIDTGAERDRFVEDDWADGMLAVGPEVVLDDIDPTLWCVTSTLAQEELPRDQSILRTVARHHRGCLGVYCPVRSPGVIRVGDPVICSRGARVSLFRPSLGKGADEMAADGAEHDTGDDVARVMDAVVHTRVGDRGGQQAQRQGRPGQLVTDHGGEGRGGGGVTGGERARGRHEHIPGPRDARTGPVRTAATQHGLDEQVGDGGGQPDRHHSADRRAARTWAGERQRRGDPQPETGTVGGIGEAGETGIEGRRRECGHGRVDRLVDAVELGQSASRP
jgi:MOSC domain